MWFCQPKIAQPRNDRLGGCDLGDDSILAVSGHVLQNDVDLGRFKPDDRKVKADVQVRKEAKFVSQDIRIP
jgi:hypothetical protein